MRRIIIFQISNLSKMTHSFKAIPIKIPAGFFFKEMNKLNLKFTQKYKGCKIAKTILQRKTKF